MNSIKELEKWCAEKIKQHPELASEIAMELQLCRDEIEEGGSESHELELAEESINQLIEENGEDSKRMLV